MPLGLGLIQLSQSTPALCLGQAVDAGFRHASFQRLAQRLSGDCSALCQNFQYGRSEDLVPHGLCRLFKLVPVGVTDCPWIRICHLMRPSVVISSVGDRQRRARQRPSLPPFYQPFDEGASQGGFRPGQVSHD